MTAWPDLMVDQKAWDAAKAELGPDASMSEIAQLAQELKREEQERGKEAH